MIIIRFLLQKGIRIAGFIELRTQISIAGVVHESNYGFGEELTHRQDVSSD